MSKINSNASSLIDDYIANQEEFSKAICELLRELIHNYNDNVIEDWKWNIPVFHKNMMVCGFAAFKKHVSLTFFMGAQMNDKYQLFTNDCSAQYTRTIKFLNINTINKPALIEYFKESFLLSENKRKKIVSTKAIFEIPELLQNALAKNNLAKENFSNMAYTYRKEYALHIAEAKRETTKLKRLSKVILNLEQNIKMHEKYKS
jgi:hypothetical protein